MTEFKPCLGKSACTDDGTHCRACGRPHKEILRTRQIIDELADLIQAANYSNVEEFTAYIARKTGHKIHHRRKQENKREKTASM
ncbi:hypothetical protein MNBD_GAMMA24-1218 [hydrothermal vent metagenome]|uniref:DUF1289 domain-containing protein n=1 Tax=hydrothermal vent metagenome TaxID=652676 RepID=A0A3B1B8B7_9ZZZZ